MTISRRTVVAGAAVGTLAPHLSWAADAGGAAPVAPKVLRYAFEVAESSLDPAKINDLYSRTLTPHIFEGLYTYDHLARPVKIKPLTADAMPRSSDDFRVWTARVRPGIYFAPDPAFKGKRRELVAQDYVYSWKRFADPANKSPVWSGMETDGYVGLPEVRQRALDTKTPFDYDKEIEGIRAIDRYTIRFTLKDPRPRFDETLAGGDLYGAVAREVIEFYGAEAETHPVGTGPFKLVQWRRSSFLAFERNPDFREMYYDAQPGADDAEGQALVARFKGRRLPMVDRVEISIIEEEQPRWLSFVNDEADVAYKVGYQFAPQAMPNGKVAPNLAKKGIRGYPVIEAASNSYLFNMDDPVVGGYTPAQVASTRKSSSTTPTTASARWRKVRRCRTRPPTTRSRRRSSVTTTRHAPKRCSTCTASSTATATAGASGPTARRSRCACRRKRRRATARSARSSTSACARWGSGSSSPSRSGPKT
jgi:ABC-type transport system substrate-binding protein